MRLTLLLNVAPQLDPTLGNRRIHVGLETAAGMVLIFIAAVLLGRFRLNGSRRTLLKFTAVAILALDNLYSAVLTMAIDSVSTGGFATWTFAADGVVGSDAARGRRAAAGPAREATHPRRADRPRHEHRRAGGGDRLDGAARRSPPERVRRRARDRRRAAAAERARGPDRRRVGHGGLLRDRGGRVRPARRGGGRRVPAVAEHRVGHRGGRVRQLRAVPVPVHGARLQRRLLLLRRRRGAARRCGPRDLARGGGADPDGGPRGATARGARPARRRRAGAGLHRLADALVPAAPGRHASRWSRSWTQSSVRSTSPAARSPR